MNEMLESNKGESPFSGLIIAVLVVVGIAIAGGLAITQTSIGYNVTAGNNTSYTQIADSSSTIIRITNQTAQNYFGNKTSTTQATAIDRLYATGYSSIIILGSTPAVFTTVVDSVGTALGIDRVFTVLIITGILAIIIGIALWLSLGRR